jgi:hypothetical protein
MKYLKKFESIEVEEDKYLIKIGCVNCIVSLERWLNDFDNINEYQKNEAQKWWSCSIFQVSKIEVCNRFIKSLDSNLDNWEICKLERNFPAYGSRRVYKSDDDTSNEIINRLIHEDIIDVGTTRHHPKTLKGFTQLEIEKKVEFINYLNDNEWLLEDRQISKVFNKSEIKFELDNLIDFYITQILYPV